MPKINLKDSIKDEIVAAARSERDDLETSIRASAESKLSDANVSLDRNIAAAEIFDSIPECIILNMIKPNLRVNRNSCSIEVFVDGLSDLNDMLESSKDYLQTMYLSGTNLWIDGLSKYNKSLSHEISGALLTVGAEGEAEGGMFNTSIVGKFCLDVSGESVFVNVNIHDNLGLLIESSFSIGSNGVIDYSNMGCDLLDGAYPSVYSEKLPFVNKIAATGSGMNPSFFLLYNTPEQNAIIKEAEEMRLSIEAMDKYSYYPNPNKDPLSSMRKVYQKCIDDNCVVEVRASGINYQFTPEIALARLNDLKNYESLVNRQAKLVRYSGSLEEYEREVKELISKMSPDDDHILVETWNVEGASDTPGLGYVRHGMYMPRKIDTHPGKFVGLERLLGESRPDRSVVLDEFSEAELNLNYEHLLYSNDISRERPKSN